MNEINENKYDELLASNKRVEKMALKIEMLQTRIEYLDKFIEQINDFSLEVDDLAFDDNNKPYYTALNRAGEALFGVLQSARRNQNCLKSKYLDEVKNLDAFLKRYGVYYPYNVGYQV